MTTTHKMQRVPFVDLWAQVKPFSFEIFETMENLIQRSAFILGSDVAAFEEDFAQYCQVKYAVGVDSGTSALELILRAYEIGTGDEVIAPANTFIATALAVSYVGATPVLVDIDPSTYNMDIQKVKMAITDRTKAIIPVHLYGQPADMDPLLEVARQHNLIVIEDACQAHGARYKGRRVGGIGHAAAFSFYPAKNLGAFGDGGMVVTNDVQVCESIRMLRDVGQSRKYHHEIKGHNHRLDSIQAAVLKIKLEYLDFWNGARRQNAAHYNRYLANSGAVTPNTSPFAEHVFHLYVIRVDDRDGLKACLAENGISTGIHYPIPIHLQPAYADLGYKKGDFPVTEKQADQILSLPMFPEMPVDMIEYVSSVIIDYLKEPVIE